MRYLFISYNTDKNLKDTQWYDTLEQVKRERGITCKKEVLETVRVASYSSPDRSGCFLLDFKEGSITIDDILESAKSNVLENLMKQVGRELKLKELGI